MSEAHADSILEPASSPSARRLSGAAPQCLGRKRHIRDKNEQPCYEPAARGWGVNRMTKAGCVAARPQLVESAAFTFRADGLPKRDRVAITREEFGRNVMRVDIEPMPETRFHLNVAVRSAPGLDFASIQCSSLRVTRPKELLSDGDDRVILQFGAYSFARQFGREVLLNSGDAVLLSNSDAGSVTYPSPASIVSLFLPRNALGPSLRDMDDCLMRPIASDTPALRLLRQYLEILKDQPAPGTHQLQHTIVTHVHDLTALALGATG